MAIKFACGSCGKRLAAKDDSAGRRSNCPRCGADIEVPVPAVWEADDEPPPVPTNLAESIAPGEGRPDYMITLIHGTFARNAAWTRDGSLLRKAIADRLAPATVEFASFHWSGGNSHRDRIRGGLALRRFLREQVKAYPDSRRFLIAHSHGGNVALYGLRRLRPRLTVKGVACLGTPFIHCAWRPENDRQCQAAPVLRLRLAPDRRGGLAAREQDRQFGD